MSQDIRRPAARASIPPAGGALLRRTFPRRASRRRTSLRGTLLRGILRGGTRVGSAALGGTLPGGTLPGGALLRGAVLVGAVLVGALLVGSLPAGTAHAGLGGTHRDAQQSAQDRGTIPPKLAGFEFVDGRYTMGVICGACHEDIYQVWQESVHANAYRDPIFQAELEEARSIAGPGIASICLTCHAPASLIVDNPQPGADPRLAEGVGCDFCHSVVAAEPGELGAFEFDLGRTKYGPLTDAVSPLHETAYSPIMDSAAMCATCHEYRGRAGAPIMTTFTEYAQGPYEQQLVVCPDCHMPLVMGRTVAEHVKETGRIGFVGFHAIPGGRSIQQIRRAVDVEVVEVTRASGSVTVRVRVENRAAGHWLPTGMPTKRLVLELSTRWDDTVHVGRPVVFGRTILDGRGVALTSLAPMILEGTRVTDDTRLRPGEIREVRQVLPAPPGSATLVVRCFYESIEDPDAVPGDIVRIERPI